MLSALGLGLFGLLLGIRHAVDPDHVVAVTAIATALLVLAAVRDTAWAIGYLMLFGLGTILGMIAVTTAIAVPAAYAANRVTAVRRYLVLASGAASVIAGTLIAVQLAGNGLFSASPVWVPR
jgi:high-affinity nickel permease